MSASNAAETGLLNLVFANSDFANTIETTAEIAGSTTLSFAPIWDANRMPITDNTLARLLRP